MAHNAAATAARQAWQRARKEGSHYKPTAQDLDMESAAMRHTGRYVRCPTCGAMAQVPCRVCEMRARKRITSEGVEP